MWYCRVLKTLAMACSGAEFLSDPIAVARLRVAMRVLVGSVIVIGCGTLTAPERDLNAPLQTDALRYQLTREVWDLPAGPVVRLDGAHIGYEYRNPTQQTIYVVKCRLVNFLLLRLSDDNEWRDMWAGSDPTRCLGPPTVIPPGEEIADTLQVGGFEPTPYAAPEFASADWPGIYRMILLSAIYLDDPADYPEGIPVEEEHLYSNQFVLEVREN